MVRCAFGHDHDRPEYNVWIPPTNDGRFHCAHAECPSPGKVENFRQGLRGWKSGPLTDAVVAGIAPCEHCFGSPKT